METEAHCKPTCVALAVQTSALTNAFVKSITAVPRAAVHSPNLLAVPSVKSTYTQLPSARLT